MVTKEEPSVFELHGFGTPLEDSVVYEIEFCQLARKAPEGKKKTSLLFFVAFFLRHRANEKPHS